MAEELTTKKRAALNRFKTGAGASGRGHSHVGGRCLLRGCDEADLGTQSSLERANRIADYFELAELMCLDALHRTESCGGHFREESQTPDGEAARDDEAFSYVAAWEFTGGAPVLRKEPLTFEYVHPSQRSYT